MSTLVVEAGRPSGTLLTASAAADQGRDVPTLPWSIYHVGGAGCRYLLSDGATLIQSAEDLLIHLGVHAVAHVDVAVSDALGEARARSDSAHQPKIARHVVESDQQIRGFWEMNRIRLKRVRSYWGGTWIGACRVCPSWRLPAGW